MYATWSSGKKKFPSKEVSREGTANFDTEPTFHFMALFLDAAYALILKEGPEGAYIRVGRATFSGKAEEADEVCMSDGAIREAMIV